MKILLIDYKGKFDIAQDEDKLTAMDIVIGEIDKGRLIAESKARTEKARYYGVSAYFGSDEELNKIFNEAED